MKSEYRSVIAIALAVGFLILWYTVISPPQKAAEAPAVTTTSATTSGSTSSPAANTAAQTVPTQVATGTQAAAPKDAVPDPQAKLPVKTWALKNGLVEVDLTSDGAIPTSWRILGFKKDTKEGSPTVDMISETPGLMLPLSLSFDGATFQFPARPKFDLVSADEAEARFVWRSAEVEVTKVIALNKGSYQTDISIEIKNLGKQPVSGRPVLVWSSVNLPEKKKSFLEFGTGPSSEMQTIATYINGGVKRETAPPKAGASSAETGSILWSGLESRYFFGAIIPRVQGEGLLSAYGFIDPKDAAVGTKGLWTNVTLPSVTASPGDTIKTSFSAYVGPKELNALKVVGVKLEESIDYGWFTIVAVPIVYCLKFFYNIIHNWGVAIILLTIFVKLLLHPINVKSLKSMKAMQQLQPRLKEIQKKYKDDKQRINQETMSLFRAHKVNPMGGCLPMLLQFPIYIALYKVLWNSIELYHAPFFWFYKDLSAPDPYFITPVLLGIFMVAQQKLMPSTSADPAQQKMMMIMPVMFSVFMLFLPVGLVVYILVNTVMSVTQQWMYNHDIGFMELIHRVGRRKK